MDVDEESPNEFRGGRKILTGRGEFRNAPWRKTTRYNISQADTENKKVFPNKCAHFPNYYSFLFLGDPLSGLGQVSDPANSASLFRKRVIAVGLSRPSGTIGEALHMRSSVQPMHMQIQLQGI